MVAESQAVSAAPLAKRKAQGIVRLTAKKLNSREKRFCVLKAQGWASRKAYQAATGCKSDATADSQAWRWQARPAVAAEIARQRALLTEEGTATRAERMHHLARVMRDDETPPAVIVSAVAVNNRMTGDDDPFAKRGGAEMHVGFFVIRVGEETPGGPGEAINVTPSAPDAPQLPP